MAVQAAGLRHKLWTGEVAARFPALRLPNGASALWQPDSGVLDAAAAAQLLAALAARVGADVRAGSRLVGWRDAGALKVPMLSGSHRVGAIAAARAGAVVWQYDSGCSVMCSDECSSL